MWCFPSLLFKRHPECIFLRFLRFFSGSPWEAILRHFLGSSDHVLKSKICERSGEGRRHRAQTPEFPSGKVRTFRGGVLPTPTAGQGLARRILRASPCAAGPQSLTLLLSGLPPFWHQGLIFVSFGRHILASWIAIWMV